MFIRAVRLMGNFLHLLMVSGYGSLGRLINHSRTCANLALRLARYEDRKRVAIFEATRNITAGEELFFDYGNQCSDPPTDTSPAWWYE